MEKYHNGHSQCKDETQQFLYHMHPF